MTDQLLVFYAPQKQLRLALCTVPQLAREAARRHALSDGSAGVLAQALTGALLLVATDRPDAPERARVDLQLDCPGPLKGLLVDADGQGAVRGLVRVNVLDRSGARTDGPPGAPGAPAGRGLTRFEAGPLLSVGKDSVAGALSVLRAAPGTDVLHRASVPFAGHDLSAGLTAFLRTERMLPGELSIEVLYQGDAPLAAVAGALLLPEGEEQLESSRALGERLRAGELHRALLAVEESTPANAHALAQELAVRLSLGPLRVEGTVRPRFQCRCSRDKVVQALRTLAMSELQEMADEDGGAELTCDFCSQQYTVGAQELRDLMVAQ